MQLKGLYTALITPFTDNNEIDIEGVKFLLQRQLAAGVDGIVLLGTTGEDPTITPTERERLIRTAVEAVNIPLMVGCGTYSTKTTIQQAIQAESLGATSLLVVVPYYNRPTQEGMYQHFKALASEVSIPICVYNIASRTGQNMETATLERLAELPHILAVKEASGNIHQMSDVIERIAMKRPHFSVLSGDDAMTLPLLAMGGHGLISVISNLLPSVVKQLVTAAQSNMQEARRLHYLLKPFVQACFIETNPIPIKRMMQLAGLPAGGVRLPLVAPQQANDAKLRELLNHSELLKCNEILTLVR